MQHCSSDLHSLSRLSQEGEVHPDRTGKRAKMWKVSELDGRPVKRV